MTGSGAVIPVVKVSGQFVQDLAVRPGDPRTFATVGDFVAEVRRLLLVKVEAFAAALVEKDVPAEFPFLVSDMRTAVARASLRDADGDHMPLDTPGADLADLLGDREAIYVCVEEHC